MRKSLLIAALMPFMAHAQDLVPMTNGTVSMNAAAPPTGFESHVAHKPDAAHSWHVLVVYRDGALRPTTGLTKKEADRLDKKKNVEAWPCGAASSCVTVNMPGDITEVEEFQ